MATSVNAIVMYTKYIYTTHAPVSTWAHTHIKHTRTYTHMRTHTHRCSYTILNLVSAYKRKYVTCLSEFGLFRNSVFP